MGYGIWLQADLHSFQDVVWLWFHHTVRVQKIYLCLVIASSMPYKEDVVYGCGMDDLKYTYIIGNFAWTYCICE